MDLNTTIRAENNLDSEAVYEVNRLAFKQKLEAELVGMLRNSNTFIPELSLVATVGDKVIGHILFTKIKIVTPASLEVESLALAPMAVMPAFQNKGVGGLLIKHGLNKARELGYRSVMVLGHEHYYPKFGFLPAAKWNIKSSYEVPVNAFMALELVPAGLDNIEGLVKYPPEFETV